MYLNGSAAYTQRAFAHVACGSASWFSSPLWPFARAEETEEARRVGGGGHTHPKKRNILGLITLIYPHSLMARSHLDLPRGPRHHKYTCAPNNLAFLSAQLSNQASSTTSKRPELSPHEGGADAGRTRLGDFGFFSVPPHGDGVKGNRSTQTDTNRQRTDESGLVRRAQPPNLPLPIFIARKCTPATPPHHDTTPHHTTPHHSTPRHATPYRTTLYRTTPHLSTRRTRLRLGYNRSGQLEPRQDKCGPKKFSGLFGTQ
jgi:hypothetical protein